MQRTLNLCLHSGGHEVEFEQVRQTPTPMATETWHPIPHHDLVESVIDTLAGAGLFVVNQAHALWQDGARYFGSFQLQNGVEHDDYALVVGLRNSHDKSFPAGLACGSGVFVCDNLAFSGEVRLARKHTKGIRRDLPRLINAAIGRLGGLKVNQEKRIAAYKGREITDVEVHDILVRSVDAQALPITKLPSVLADYREPKHVEFQPRTAWSLFNSYTEVLKGGSPEILSRRTIPLHGLMDQVCGLRVLDEQEFRDAEIVGGQLAMGV